MMIFDTDFQILQEAKNSPFSVQKKNVLDTRYA